MAELSAETQAIIQRLKDEGELVRNRGTNSIRSVKIEMNKFQEVFNVISANIQQQTSILRQQAGFAAEALEQQKSKEQLDELRPEQNETSNATDQKIEKIGDQIEESINKAMTFRGALDTLKNIAMIGGGLFIGYNLLKGFIDEQTGGGWSQMEEGIGALGPKLREFANFDIDGIRGQFNQLVTDIGSMSTSLANISTSLGSILDTFNAIADMNILEIAGTVLLAMNSLSAAVWATRYVFRRMTLDLENGRRASGGRTWWQRALGITPETPNGTGANATRFNPDGTVRGDAQSARPGARPAPTPGTPVAPAAGGGRGSYGTTREGRAQMRAGIAASLPNQYRVDSMGRLQRTGGGVVSDADAERILQETLRNMPPKYAKAFNLIKGLITKVGVPVLTAVAALQIAFILADESKTDEEKMQALAPILGSIFGGVGFAALGAAIGTFGGPWGTLIGGIVGGIAGSLAGEQLGYYIAKWAFDEEPTEEERRAMVAEREALAASTNEFAGFEDSYNGTTVTPPATPTQPSAPQRVPPRPTGGGHTGRTARQRWDNQYGATHNADGTPIIQGSGRGSIVEGAGERAAYQAMINSLVESEGVAQRRLDEVAAAGASGGGAVVINAPTTVSPNINNVSGGRSLNQVSVRGTGGGGGGPSINPYGLPGFAN